MSRSNNHLADVFDTITTLPVVFPPTVLGYYLLIFIGRQSSIGKFLEDHFGITLVFTPAGAVIAALVVSIPFLIRYARSAFADIDPDVLDAARLLGRNEVHVFFSVAVPIAWRGVATGIIMAFARALGDFGATLMVSGDIPGYTRTMPLAVYDAMQAGDLDLANRLVIIMTVTAVMLLFFAQLAAE